MRYRRITTTGQIREKKKERRQSIYVWLIVIVILAILVGVGYLATPSTVLLQQTAFRGISYRPLMAFVMLFTAIFVIVIGILLADKYTKVGYYLKTIAFGIVIGMLFHGMGVNLLLNMNHWLARRSAFRKHSRAIWYFMRKMAKSTTSQSISAADRLSTPATPERALKFQTAVRCCQSESYAATGTYSVSAWQYNL